MKVNKFEELISSISGSTILKGMPELAYVFNDKGQMLMWNKNIETVLGYSKEELFLKNIVEFIDIPDQEKTIKSMQLIFEKKEQQTIEYNLVTKSGKKTPYVGSGSYAVHNGEEYFVGMAINISNVKDTERKLIEKIKETNELKNHIQAENIYLRRKVESVRDFKNIIGETKSHLHALYRVEQVTKLGTTVLIEGETDTGKEIFAMAIHSRSNRKDKAFVKVHCSALSKSQIESELFGHEKGSFLGALQKQIGIFELADKGTIFIDEVDEIPIELQSKIIRVLEEGKIKRIGASKSITVDVRVIVATNKDLKELIKQKKFREDLYYRINVYPITLPPLRERISDIPILVNHFVDRFNISTNRNIKRATLNTMKILEKYTWPGNIRELENIIERAIIISTGEILRIEPFYKTEIADKKTILSLAETEKQHIIKALSTTYWQVSGASGAARILDIHPETLRSKMRKLGINRPINSLM
ncbi:MAG: hypothetical protein B6I18_07255 [Bacteroidetes bacterium 4572_112]|nr:MAG: hypothetical protein B6I18_07255 [Bacteroidetes bacterium 4572_112]